MQSKVWINILITLIIRRCDLRCLIVTIKILLRWMYYMQLKIWLVNVKLHNWPLKFFILLMFLCIWNIKNLMLLLLLSYSSCSFLLSFWYLNFKKNPMNWAISQDRVYKQLNTYYAECIDDTLFTYNFFYLEP